MTTPNDKHAVDRKSMSLEERILSALRSGPLHPSEVAAVIGMDEARTRAWLMTLRENGLIRVTGDGRYEVNHD